MQRREFSKNLVSVGLVGTAFGAQAQTQAPTQALTDSEFTTLSKAVHTEPGKIEVTEFFLYGCSHCFGFEPLLEPWTKKLPQDVRFKRVPLAFHASVVIHQRIYYALEAMHKTEAMHAKIFNAIHVDKQRLDKEEDIVTLMVKNGIDAKQFTETFNSFSIAAKAKQATRLAADYKIEGVPTLAINGKYTTSGAQAGSLERSLLVAEALIARERKGA
jgi:protein dithiol oxidoreductase (disulfide-forming)